MLDQTGGDTQEVAVCHICGRLFDSQVRLSDHLMKDHENEVLPDQPLDDAS
jgi:hypothetical protein